MKIYTTRLTGAAWILVCLFWATGNLLWATPQQLVSGTITDTQENPIPGVSIRLLHRNTGTQTDMQGAFSIQAQPSDTLSISYLGFKMIRLPVGKQTTFTIVLQQDVTDLGEVTINAGYYNTTRREQTGSIARVTGEEIERQPVTNPLTALQGRMAGVSIVQRSGVPGNAPVIQIRGQNSLRSGFGNSGNLPLYIIDGVPIDSAPLNSFSGLTSPTLAGIDPLNSLNPVNIASIEILKDADATAIYGSRGANGVILITTKKGSKGRQKTQFDVQVYRGAGRVPRKLNLINTQDYINLREEAFANDGATPTESNAADLVLWDPLRYTDWQEKLFGGTAETTGINLGASGGSETTQYTMGLGYQRETSVFPGDFLYNKFTANLNLSQNSRDDRFKLQFNTSFGSDRNRQFDGVSFVSTGLSLAPNAPEVYGDDGELNWEDSSWTNPFSTLYRESEARVQQLISSLSLSYSITTNLEARLNSGYTLLHSDELVKQPLRFYNPALWSFIDSRSLHVGGQRESWIAEPQLNYRNSWGKISLDALVGSTIQHRKNTGLNMVGIGYANEQLLGNLAAAEQLFVTDNTTQEYAYAAAFGRIGLHYARKYYLNLTGRRDGSSRFGPSRRFANFGAIGGAWIVSEESWMQDLKPVLSFTKLRGSYGSAGSDQIGDYGYLDTYSATPGGGGLYPTQLTNPIYSWERNRKLELAAELGFLNDHLRLNTSWYRNRSSNQLVGYNLPAITGFSSVQANLDATVENTGWEFEVATHLNRGRFNWQASLNMSIPQNRLIAFPGIDESSYANIYKVGKSLNIQFLYDYTGVDPETGLYTFEDVNEDGVYNFDDRVLIKDLTRSLFGGFRNQFTYGRLNLDFLWEFVVQEGQQYYPNIAPGRLGAILQEDYERRWQNPGDVAVVQKASQVIDASRAYNRLLTSEGVYTNTSFLRLKTLGLSYKLLTENWGIHSCVLFLQGQNLLTFTRYRGLDAQSSGTNLPALQMFTAGLKLNF
ncbi:SusC/RagA family TonB-linked outer membrane protein [Leeuwenhoekiella blandensis]|uniref:SusC/RagA family TonB-linked outer membrane protein n=1 Tax=Leeuwenhoekiella blandensis TaxID=360293 RepID=UPI0023561828|nr:SusC/RagA family TonB-linked outer membrane protein [Leeuwenhoekiella blandensis]|tara:strand:+ start:354 stop:3344 length:2991 start_codon:yes stop_codon:yes gene_type:complete